MAEEQPTFKVVDRRPFKADGTPRELSAEEREEAERAEKAAAVQEAAVKAATAEAAATPLKASPRTSAPTASQAEAKPAAPVAQQEPSRASGDPHDDPASFLSLIMSVASNAAASLGMMPHPATGETGVDLKTAKHWIDVLGMLDNKTQGNLGEQEAQVLEGLLADLRMQYVSFSGAPPPAKFSASDITGGK